MRAGLTLTVDIDLKIGSLAETVTVSGESPMIETNRPTSVINIEGDLLRAAPITSRRLFSDALDMAPGIGSRNVDDGVGRRAYYFRGSHIYAHAFQLEGAPASAYIDSAAHSMGMGGDTVQDVEIKLGGADASTPLSTGVVMNVVTPRGQNQFKGSATYSLPADGLEQRQHQRRRGAGRSADVAVGEPVGPVARRPHRQRQGLVLRDLSLRRSAERHQPDADRPALPDGVQADFRAVRQQLEEQAALRQSDDAARQARAVRVLPERQEPLHELARALYARDQSSSAGGSMVLGKLNSVWGSAADHSFSASYNNKGGNDEERTATHGIWSAVAGPSDCAHLERRPTGNGILVEMNNVETQVAAALVDGRSSAAI